ncbi:MAG: preprotein translocase subunit SecE [Candidatus Saccharibacteria bacterium]|nr:preprotein translocase subunit SecE [Candidatus Saccharibacteria bacterium]
MAKITRIKASDHREAEAKEEPSIVRKKVVIKDKKADKANKKAQKVEEKKSRKANTGKKHFILFRPFCAIGRYFKESWQEIRQVRWPNRKATWKMVLAVIIYSAIFVAILLLLDLLFSFIFNNILK